ncbi:ScbR family autoregulator-binding transcription factor [Streptomyces marincola]|uniref:TetR family transcriptional regulator n=1 Tax=Streptomyces marincola TaxID=2878388 RepID=A0A1W7D259_9ACTN|nr:ScbR family autoregulator-binding transcription factor [Streptomyces marincola]ARQ71082.1 TetR family transcriptional regulator [Streptomyces marincola]
MARQARAIRTRRTILEAAAAVFDECGYEASTIAQILDRAEVTRGALYFHFGSKEDLARSVLAEAVTTEGLGEQEFTMQEFVDAGLLLAHRLPREPLLSAALRLSIDQRARAAFGTRWPDWIDLGARLLTRAKERGEVFPHVSSVETARLFVGSWTGVGVVGASVAPSSALVTEVAHLLRMMIPSIAVPGVAVRLDLSPRRPARLLAARAARPD